MGNTKNDSVFPVVVRKPEYDHKPPPSLHRTGPRMSRRESKMGGSRKKAILIKTDHLAAKLCSVFFLFSEQSLRPQARLVFSQPKQLKGSLNEGKIELE